MYASKRLDVRLTYLVLDHVDCSLLYPNASELLSTAGIKMYDEYFILLLICLHLTVKFFTKNMKGTQTSTKYNKIHILFSEIKFTLNF